MKVAFFKGCLIDKAFPSIARSVLEVLGHFKTQVFIPKHQGCCGMPAFASGDEKTFESIVINHAELFSKERFDYLVTACAACSSTIINLWPSVLKTRDKMVSKKIAALVEKTVDISWLLEKRYDLTLEIFKEKKTKHCITYHDPCHLKKSLGIFKEPRRVLAATGHTMKEMKDNDVCCGMGGNFNLQHDGRSSKAGELKVDNMIATGCDTVSTSCPACMMQISDMLAGQKKNISVRHPVEIYAEALRRYNRS